jgi:hypothetical protein
LLTLALAIASCGPGEHHAPVPSRGPAKILGVTRAEPGEVGKANHRRMVYVPVFMFIQGADDARPVNLAITLYIRNTDPSAPLFINSVRLNDSSGRQIRQDVEAPLRVAPLASAVFFIRESDTTGGASPAYLVEWSGEKPINEPVIEAVMAGTAMNQGIALISPGRTLPGPAR